MQQELSNKMKEYKTYAEYFFRQIATKEIFEELSGDKENYGSYITLCSKRLYDFQTWFEHTTSLPYPEDTEWKQNSTFKFSKAPFAP